MFEKIVTTALNKVLGKFIENVDPSQLKISLSGGEVKFNNMKLKQDIFESLPIPLTLVQGQVGLIDIKIPIMNLKSKPIIVILSDVYVIVRPKHIDEWKVDREEQAYLQKTQDRLEEYEDIEQSTEILHKSHPSIFDKYREKIIDNIQITVKNVYLRYEDDQSAQNYGDGSFSIGILLKELSLQNTDDKWMYKKNLENGESNASDVNHKVVLINSLGIFLDYKTNNSSNSKDLSQNQAALITQDEKTQIQENRDLYLENLEKELLLAQDPNSHQFILFNASLEGRISLNKNPIENRLPQININLILGSTFYLVQQPEEQQNIGIKFSLYQSQISRILKLVEYTGYYIEFQKGALYKYYAFPITQDIARDYIQNYIEWVGLTASVKSIQADEKREQLKLIEDQSTFDKIIVLRKFANKLQEQENDQRIEEQIIDEKVKEKKKQKRSIWGIFASKAKKEQDKMELQKFREKLQKEFELQDEEKKKGLYTELSQITEDLGQGAQITNEDFDQLPGDYNRFQFKLRVPSIKLGFFNEFDQQLLHAQIDEVQSNFSVGQQFSAIDVSLLDIRLSDCWTGVKSFPNIIETKELNEGGQPKEDQNGQTQQKQLLIIKYEENQKSSICPYKILVETQRTIFVVVNANLLSEVQRTIKAATQAETLDFTFYKQTAIEKTDSIFDKMKNIVDQIKSGTFNHKALSLTLFITLPVLIIPQDIFQPQKICLVVDGGNLELKSSLVTSESFVDYKLITDAAMLYDKYEAKLSGVNINILQNGLSSLSSYQKEKGTNLIENFTAVALLYNCIEAMHPMFPAAELKLIITNIDIKFSLLSIKSLLQIKNSLDQIQSEKEQQIFKIMLADIESAPGAIVVSETAYNVAKSMINEVRTKAREIREQQAITDPESATQQELEMFQHLREAINSEELVIDETLENVVDSSTAAALEQKESLGANFNIYFTIEQLQLRFLEENEDEDDRNTDQVDQICGILKHLAIKFEYDRKQDISINATVSSLSIDSSQSGNLIAKQFRSILSNQISEMASSSTASTNQDITKKQSDLFVQAADDISVVQNLQEGTQQDTINHWELSFSKSQNEIKVKVQLNGLRLIVPLPVIIKIIQIDKMMKVTIEDLYKENVLQIIQKINQYESILENFGQLESNDNEGLLKKILRNQLKIKKIEQTEGLLRYGDRLKKYQQIWERQEDVYQGDAALPTFNVQQTIQKQESNEKDMDSLKNSLRSQIRKNLKQEEQTTKISLTANLTNFCLKVPLNAEDDLTPIFQLLLVSNIRYESQINAIKQFEPIFGTRIKQENLETNDQLSVSINHFTLEMLTYNQQNNQEQPDTQPVVKMNKILAPCRISLSLDSYQKDDIKLLRHNISIDVEPLHFKIGFQELDTIIQAYKKIDYSILKELKQYKKSKESSQILQPEIQNNFTQVEDQDDIYQTNNEPSVEQKNKDDLLLKQILEQTQSKKKKKQKQMGKVSETNEKVTQTNLKVACEQLTISLYDESEQIEHSLVYATIQSAQMQFKQNEQKDNAAIYILKKMGVFKKNNPLEAKSQVFRDLKAFAKLNINYYNPRSLAFEPLLEPYYLTYHLNQDAPYTAQNMRIQSNHMLNLNFSYGMVLTAKRIINQIDLSLQKARINDQLEQQEANKLPVEKIINQVDQVIVQDKWGKQYGFIFENHTGLDIVFNVHDDEAYNNDTFKDYNRAVESRGINVLEKYQLPKDGSFFLIKGAGNEQIFKTFDELYDVLNEINLRNNKGKFIEPLEEDPLLVDVKIEGVDRVASIPIEGLGVYSYTANIEIKNYYNQQDGSINTKRVGIICSVTMDGMHKKVSIQSQLLVANNLDSDIIINCSELDDIQYEMAQDKQIVLKAGKVLRAPISWLVGNQAMNLFIYTYQQPQLLLAQIEKNITPKHLDSKLSQKSSQIFKIQEDKFAAVNFQAFYCQQAHPEDYPLQYVVSFDSPLQITNHNFRPLEVILVDQQLSLAQITPKDSAFINNIDISNVKQNLQWNFFETQNQIYSTHTDNFNVTKNIDHDKLLSFKPQELSANENDQQLKMLVKKYSSTDLQDYEDNFTFREKRLEYVSSAEIIIYPQYMIVNKTKYALDFGGKTVEAKSSLCFSTSHKKIKIKAPGYNSSKDFDITQNGVPGHLSLVLSKENAIQDEQIILHYIPQKLDLGVVIDSAPVPYDKTTIVTISPRYLIINQLQQPLVVKQKDCEEQVIVQDHQVAFNFQEKHDQYLMFRQAKQGEVQSENRGMDIPNDLAIQELDFWSSPFYIDDLDDFQVSLPLSTPQEGLQNFQWYQSHPENNFQRFVRVMVTTQDDATILIVLTDPDIPEYQIQNKTNFEIKYAQITDKAHLNKLIAEKHVLTSEDYLVGTFKTLKPNSSIAYAWADKIQLAKKLVLKINDKFQVLNINRAQKKKILDINDDESVSIEVKVSGSVKTIKITTIDQERLNNKQASYLQYLVKRYQGQQRNIDINLRGIGLSIMDQQPKELLYISFYDIQVSIQKRVESTAHGTEIITRGTVNIGHLQLDNMYNNVMPVMLAPMKPLIHKQIDNSINQVQITTQLQNNFDSYFEEEKVADINKQTYADILAVPFIQFQVSIAKTFENGLDSSNLTRVRGFQLSIQEFFIQLETQIIHQVFLLEDAIKKQIIDLKFNQEDVLNTVSFEDSKNIKSGVICKDLDAQKDIVHNESKIKSKKIFIEYVHLNAVKFNVSLQLEKKAFDFSSSNTRRSYGAKGILFSVLAGAASITDSTLTFNELILIDTFITTDRLTDQVGKNYAYQAASQFYKLIGSCDILGNPLGFIDKIGAGVMEFFNEPSNKHLRGHDDQQNGFGSRVKGLMADIAVGSLESVSKVTGTLYKVIKNLSGDEEVKRDQPEDASEGIHMGIRGGAEELVGGAKGLVKKPEQKERIEGGKGIAKGVGEGIVGAVTAPVTATLKVGSTVADGIANQAEDAGNTDNNKSEQIDVKYYRFRDPRFINTKRIIQPYNKELSQANQFMNSVRNSKYSKQQIHYFAPIPETNEQGIIINNGDEIDGSMIIITNKMFLYLRILKEGANQGKAELIFKSPLKRIFKCEVFRAQQVQIDQQQQTEYQAPPPTGVLYGMLISIKLSKKKQGASIKLAFQTNEYGKFEKIYDFLSLIPECEGIDSVRMIEEKSTKSIAER